MTRDDIVRMARKAWIMDKHDCSDDLFVRTDIDERNIFEFAALVAAAEREACAKVCEQLVSPYAESVGSLRHATLACATAIRERGQESPR